jgi:hypothetical protein
VAHTYSPRGIEAGGSQIQDQPGLHINTLSQTNKQKMFGLILIMRRHQTNPYFRPFIQQDDLDSSKGHCFETQENGVRRVSD